MNDKNLRWVCGTNDGQSECDAAAVEAWNRLYPSRPNLTLHGCTVYADVPTQYDANQMADQVEAFIEGFEAAWQRQSNAKGA